MSSYQGTVDWAAVTRWQLSHHWTVPGGIFKLGEVRLDPFALRNASELHRLNMAAVGYVFVRPGLKASTVIGWAKQANLRVVVLDEEVSGIQGTAASLVPGLRTHGLTVVDYHSLRNIFDTTAQGLPCWVADYGPSTPPGCTTGQRVAWQFTDMGSVPGITGIVDQSISYGLLKLAGPTAAQIAHYQWLVGRAAFWYGQFDRCVRFADGIGCARAEHWWLTRTMQATEYRAKYGL